MKVSYLFLGFIAVLLWVTAVGYRDSDTNSDYKCYVHQKGC